MILNQNLADSIVKSISISFSLASQALRVSRTRLHGTSGLDGNRSINVRLSGQKVTFCHAGANLNHIDLVNQFSNIESGHALQLPSADREFTFGNTIISTDRTLVIATDAMGTAPLYWRTCSDSSRIEISSDVCQLAAGDADADPVSLAEFMMFGRLTSPQTVWRNVQRLWPGSVYVFVRHDRQISASHFWYWRPGHDAAIPDAGEVGPELRRVVSGSVESALRPNSALLFSGGLDSRILLGLAHSHGIAPRPYMKNFGTTLDGIQGRLAAQLMGARIAVVDSQFSDYVADVREKLTAVGLGIDVRNAHFWGIEELSNHESCIDGWTADSLWKGYLARPETPHRGPKENALHEEIAGRRAVKRKLLSSLSSEASIAWEQIWPISDHRDFGFRAFLQAQRPHSSSPFLSGASAALAARTSAPYVPSDLLARTFASVLGSARVVPHGAGGRSLLPHLNRVERAAAVSIRRALLTAGRMGALPSRDWPTLKQLAAEWRANARTDDVKSLFRHLGLSGEISHREFWRGRQAVEAVDLGIVRV